jgi:hypothetical protein
MEDRQGTQTGTTTSERTRRIEVKVGTARFVARASELDGTARADLWPKLVEAAPSIGEFQAQTTHQIPLLLLSP